MRGTTPKTRTDRIAAQRRRGGVAMTGTAAVDDGTALPDREPAARGTRGSRARRFLAWFTGTGYRPERHYMRGGGRGGAVSPRPFPA